MMSLYDINDTLWEVCHLDLPYQHTKQGKASLFIFTHMQFSVLYMNTSKRNIQRKVKNKVKKI